MLRCVFICLVIAAAAFTVVVAAANCGWLRLATMVAIGCCCCRLVSWLVGLLVGWLFGCCCCSLFGWLVDLCVNPHTKSKNIYKNGISFHICTHRKRERVRGKTCCNIGVATATRTKLGTNSQHYIHIESGNQREKERARYIFMYNLSVCETDCLFETNVATFLFYIYDTKVFGLQFPINGFPIFLNIQEFCRVLFRGEREWENE